MPTLSDEVLRALAHTERRRILRLCMVQSMAAGELAKDAGMSSASVSEHLKVLRKTGLAYVEKRGKFWYYRTDVARLEAVIAQLKKELMEDH